MNCFSPNPSLRGLVQSLVGRFPGSQRFGIIPGASLPIPSGTVTARTLCCIQWRRPLRFKIPYYLNEHHQVTESFSGAAAFSQALCAPHFERRFRLVQSISQTDAKLPIEPGLWCVGIDLVTFIQKISEAAIYLYLEFPQLELVHQV